MTKIFQFGFNLCLDVSYISSISELQGSHSKEFMRHLAFWTNTSRSSQWPHTCSWHSFIIL